MSGEIFEIDVRIRCGDRAVANAGVVDLAFKSQCSIARRPWVTSGLSHAVRSHFEPITVSRVRCDWDSLPANIRFEQEVQFSVSVIAVIEILAPSIANSLLSFSLIPIGNGSEFLADSLEQENSKFPSIEVRR
jgi:hypothetical protein